MLNKPVCFHCYKKRMASNNADINDWNNMADFIFRADNSLPAEQRFEIFWKQFQCPCLHCFRNIFYENPPHNCPYILEHTLVNPSFTQKFVLCIKYLWHMNVFHLCLFLPFLLVIFIMVLVKLFVANQHW